MTIHSKISLKNILDITRTEVQKYLQTFGKQKKIKT